MNQNVTTTSQVTFAGITGSLRGTASYATTSATAATASLVNGLVSVSTAYIGGALYTTSTSNSVATNITIFTISTVVGYTSGFIDYHVTDGGTNARSGQIQIAYVGGQVVYNETTTQDIGDTSGFNWNVLVSGADINLESVVTSGTWNIKLIARAI